MAGVLPGKPAESADVFVVSVNLGVVLVLWLPGITVNCSVCCLRSGKITKGFGEKQSIHRTDGESKYSQEQKPCAAVAEHVSTGELFCV